MHPRDGILSNASHRCQTQYSVIYFKNDALPVLVEFTKPTIMHGYCLYKISRINRQINRYVYQKYKIYKYLYLPSHTKRNNEID